MIGKRYRKFNTSQTCKSCVRRGSRIDSMKKINLLCNHKKRKVIISVDWWEEKGLMVLQPAPYLA